MKYILEERILKIEVNSLFNETIQDFLDEFIPSKKIQHLLIQNKWLTLDGNPCKREDYIAGLYLEINIYPYNYDYKKVDMVPDIVYEDEIILVVNKPKGVLVHSDGVEENTLSEWIKSYYASKPYISCYPLHRLDMETCGLVIFVKSPIFKPLLDLLLKNKQIRRSYLAFVLGKIPKDQTMIIDKPIGKDRHNSQKQVIYKNGQKAITKIRSLGYSKKNDFSIIRCLLETGRTHQIRIHLASIGHSILNDPLYGEKTMLCKRMGLIADELSFYNPLKQEMIDIDIDLPNDLYKLYAEVLK